MLLVCVCCADSSIPHAIGVSLVVAAATAMIAARQSSSDRCIMGVLSVGLQRRSAIVRTGSLALSASPLPRSPRPAALATTVPVSTVAARAQAIGEGVAITGGDIERKWHA